MQCNVCKEFFNPCDLGSVFEHEHKNIDLKGTPLYGKKMKCDCTPCRDGWPNLCEKVRLKPTQRD